MFRSLWKYYDWCYRLEGGIDKSGECQGRPCTIEKCSTRADEGWGGKPCDFLFKSVIGRKLGKGRKDGRGGVH